MTTTRPASAAKVAHRVARALDAADALADALRTGGTLDADQARDVRNAAGILAALLPAGVAA